MEKDGLLMCSRMCINKNIECQNSECKYWLDFGSESNCCLISIYQNGQMTLRQIGDRLGISFARVKQIETEALRKIKKNPLINE